MGGRIVAPVLEQTVYVPHRKLINLMERPSGSSSDVAVDKGPLRYTGTGVGSPTATFLRPETSSTALKSTMKSSKVRPFSSCSALRSWCTFLTEFTITGRYFNRAQSPGISDEDR